MSFWISQVGKLDGTPESAFTKTNRIIPDNTMVLAMIKKFELAEYNGNQFHQITWKIVDGEFKNQEVRQKIHTFDLDNNKRHRGLNMMMLIFKMFNESPKSNDAPTTEELNMFCGKIAGIKVNEFPRDDGKTGNWVSEVHAAAGFKPEQGVKLEVTAAVVSSNNAAPMDSAFSRNQRTQTVSGIDDDLPF